MYLFIFASVFLPLTLFVFFYVPRIIELEEKSIYEARRKREEFDMVVMDTQKRKEASDIEALRYLRFLSWCEWVHELSPLG